jgi:hypothetical protein
MDKSRSVVYFLHESTANDAGMRESNSSSAEGSTNEG